MKPVFRSWEVSPAIDEAMQTAVPTISAVALPARSVQPKRRKIALVPSSVAIVIPDVGFEVTPTRPTIRELTVTKKKAKTAMRIEATNRDRNRVDVAEDARHEGQQRGSRAIQSTTVRKGEVQIGALDGGGGSARHAFRDAPALSRKDSIIVGIDLISVMMPPVATAPAPM